MNAAFKPRLVPPPQEPTDINLLIIEDIRKRDWDRVHIEADKRAPITLRLRRWFYSSPQNRPNDDRK